MSLGDGGAEVIRTGEKAGRLPVIEAEILAPVLSGIRSHLCRPPLAYSYCASIA